jgi:hypothetical protein
MTALRRLNLVFSASLEDAVTAALIEHQPPLPGFTLLKAEGHSGDFSHASVEERVRGRVDRRVLWMVLAQDEAAALVAFLRSRVRSRDVVWWVEPVESFGRLQ